MLDLKSLNPYCSGQWSRTIIWLLILNFGKQVLILIVVDNGLVLVHSCPAWHCQEGLNPYCSGQWSRTDNARFVPWC